MPHFLALFLCALFVVFLLWLEHKQCPNVSRALWLPTIWMLYTASRPLNDWLPSSAEDWQLGSPLDRAFLIALLCGALFLLIRRKFDWTNAIKGNAWVIILLIYMFLSISWSSIPYVSFKRWMQELLAVLMAFSLLSEPSPRESMESVLRRTIYVLIPFSMLLIRYFPDFGIKYNRWDGSRMWVGMAMQKNSLGRICLIGAFLIIWSLVRTLRGINPPVWKYQAHVEFIMLIFAFWLMRGPRGSFFYSATSFFALCVGFLVYCGLKIKKKIGGIPKARTIMIIVLMGVVFGTATLFVGPSSMGTLASAAGRDTTLTGRAGIWAALLPIAMQSPLLGHGFGGFWLSQQILMIGVSSAHSGYLDVLMGLGFIGILFTSIFLLFSGWKAHQALKADFEWGALWICFLVMTVVYNISESSISSLTSHLTAIVLFFTVSFTSVSSSLKNHGEG